MKQFYVTIWLNSTKRSFVMGGDKERIAKMLKHNYDRFTIDFLGQF